MSATHVLRTTVARPAALLALLALVSTSGCAGNLVMNKVADAMSSGSGTVFSGDDDPELIADAIPFALKTYESLLQSVPEHENLLLATGSAFTMYAFAFVQFPSDTLPDAALSQRQAAQARARNMYLRARGYLFRALDIRYPGFSTAVLHGDIDSLLRATSLADTSLLYWTGMAWMGAFTADKFNMTLTASMPRAVALVRRVMELRPDMGNGACHDFFTSYYGAMPASLGGSEQKSREHFARAVELSKGTNAGPYVALASTVCINRQDIAEFRTLMEKAIAIELDSNPGNRLANILSQRKARWYLSHIEDFFLDAAPADSSLETP